MKMFYILIVGGNMGLYICQNLSDCILKMGTLYSM